MRSRNCKPCDENDHEGCWSIFSPYDVDQCDCYDATPEDHETKRAHERAMGLEPDDGEIW